MRLAFNGIFCINNGSAQWMELSLRIYCRTSNLASLSVGIMRSPQTSPLAFLAEILDSVNLREKSLAHPNILEAERSWEGDAHEACSMWSRMAAKAAPNLTSIKELVESKVPKAHGSDKEISLETQAGCPNTSTKRESKL